MNINNPFVQRYNSFELPNHTQVVKMNEPTVLDDCNNKIKDSLLYPIDSPSLSSIAKQKREERKIKDNKEATAVIVVSDKTRPVPYRGEDGILLPIIEELLLVGYKKDNITILIATGTHLPMAETEIWKMIDTRVRDMGIKVLNHDCKDNSNLTFLGKTKSGTEMWINSIYVNADLKIATGLVESHFMAGASGGRKAICPGLIGEESTFVFHGYPFMADKNSRDLNLKDNLVHEEALEVAATVGIDFLVNVTLNGEFKITGIFSGNYISAHLKAVESISECVRVPSPSADIVVTHGGFVGINHYQVAKCAVASLGVLKKDGYLVIIADTNDPTHPVGGINYITTLALLTRLGAKEFTHLIASDDWPFIPEQWQVQMWCKVFDRIPMDHLIFYSPSMNACWYPLLPGQNGNTYLSPETNSEDVFRNFISNTLSYISKKEGKNLDEMDITWIEDGPYVVPVPQKKS
ncbi:MAG: DUF2088 domain-containing protein [Spirochaetia bacterium]|nr:DUF2088 domain-containing protein [Spirochaetia bacterium]